MRPLYAVREEYAHWARGLDGVVTLSTLGEAPAAASTGDPVCCTRWTLVGAPAFSLPAGLGADGLPLGVQLVGMPGRDQALAGTAAWLESALPSIGRPRVPS